MSVSDKLIEFRENKSIGAGNKELDLKQTSRTEDPFLVEAESMRAPEALSPGEARPPKPSPDMIELFSLPLNELTPVFLCYGTSPSHFYLHLADSSQLDKLTDLMQTTYTKKISAEEMQNASSNANNNNESDAISELEPGSLCAAFSLEDKSWYRARIVSIDDEQAMVDYIDYGNSERIPLKDLKALENEVMSIPAQAGLCYLSDAVIPNVEKSATVNEDGENTVDGWSADIVETFLAEAGMQRELTACAQSKVDPLTGKQAVCLSYDGVSIAKMMNVSAAETSIESESTKPGYVVRRAK